LAEFLDGYRLSPLPIGRLDYAEIFALAADDDDAPAPQLSGGGPLSSDFLRGHGRKIMAAESGGESTASLCYHFATQPGGTGQNGAVRRRV
jgi:hypothetical protein